jgi:hypothetical protein
MLTIAHQHYLAGSWKPNANDSHGSQQSHYKGITDNSYFNRDHAVHDDNDNDLVVSVYSQLGGLPNQIRPYERIHPLNESAIYPYTVHVHARVLIKSDKDVFSETNSPRIQKDVIILLGSSDNNKFADAIGIGSPYHHLK